MAQGQQADNLSWANRVQSMQDNIDLYTYVNSRALATNERIGNESQVLTNQIWKGRVEDLQEKSAMYVDIVSRDNAQNLRLCDELYKRREQDVQEKADLFARLSTRISDLEKKEAATAAALPLMFELNKVNAERYTDACCCKSETNLLMTANGLQRQLDHKIDGQLKYAYSDLCAPVSTLTVTQRWAKVVNVSTTGTEYVQVTKFDVIYNIQYTDCKGNVRVSTESTSTIMETAATSETITTLTPTVTKVIDVIIPNGVSIVSQQVLDELPTSLPVKGHCAYSVFDVRVTPAPAPTAAIASVAKSK